MKKKKDKKGFTLVELLIVLGIICVLALIITPIIINYRNKANDVYNDKLKDNVITVAKEFYTGNRSELPNGYPEGKYATFVTLFPVSFSYFSILTLTIVYFASNTLPVGTSVDSSPA